MKVNTKENLDQFGWNVIYLWLNYDTLVNDDNNDIVTRCDTILFAMVVINPKRKVSTGRMLFSNFDLKEKTTNSFFIYSFNDDRF